MTRNPLSPARDEENRRLAEWLEPFNSFNIPFATDSLTESPLKAWCTVRHGFEDWRWEPRNFRTDEAANALLLEKMHLPTLDRRSDGWHCYGYGVSPRRAAFSLDRKTAIVKAALAYLEAQK